MKTAIATLLPLMLAVAAVPASAGLQEDLVAMEKANWTAWGKADGEAFRKNLSEDAVQVVAGTEPLAGRDAIVKEISANTCVLKTFDFKDVKLRQLTPDVAILSYTATQDTTCDGTKLPPKVHSTAIYVKKDGKWLNANYQETPLE